MPGNVSNSSPSAVLPASLCTAFVHSRQFPVQENRYRNGESQREKQTDSSRKSWKLSKRLTPAALTALVTFYRERRGGLDPFYFYDPYEAEPVGSNFDPTGAVMTGRYTVVFRGELRYQALIARSEVSLELVEVN